MSSIISRHSDASAMIMVAGVPSLFHMQRIFWAFIGTAIGVATLANVLNIILYHQRLSNLKDVSSAARPRSLFFQAHATLSAIIREFSYYSAPLSFRNRHFYLPPVGPVLIMVAYIVLIVVCAFYRFNTRDFLQWEDIGYRVGFIAVAQLPLIVLLAGKRNIIGYITGVGYERLNWLHRWVARSLLFTIAIHMGFWLTEWGKYDYIMTKIKTDAITQKGFAAFGVLCWLVLSSFGPIRGLSYEFFVVQHVISWIGFMVAVYLHVPDENLIWIWLPVGFWAFDRVLRATLLFYTNLSILHKNSSGILACKATFEPLDESHTRIIIANPPITWKAGQHLFLTCHPLAPLSSHPFTIASLPEDGRLEFVVRAKRGATRKFFKYAEKIYPSLPSSTPRNGRSVLIEGPYARIRPLRQFDSLVFIAGSTGATFTVPLMRDIVQQWMGVSKPSRFTLQAPAGAITRHIKFIWILKRSISINWFATQLSKVVADADTLRNGGHDIAVDINIYVTCDDALTSGQSSIICDKPERRSSTDDEKKAITSTLTELSPHSRSSSPSSSSSSTKQCCCKTLLTSEPSINRPCTCSSSLSSPSPSSRLIDPRIPLLSGRPHVRNLIRKSAEMALGEMAVVVCGPPGLVQSTRNAVVGVSDERAVHKGTGAQGIYVHAESFGYA